MNKTIIIAEHGKQDLIIEREFDAPRDLVFRAHTDPELYSQWLGPDGYKTRFERFEPKSGGSYRFVNIDEKGDEFVFHGVYHEVEEPESIIGTFEWEGMPGHVSLEKAEFFELPNNRTKLISHSIYLSEEDRNGMMGDGAMEKGVNEGYDKLDKLLEKMK